MTLDHTRLTQGELALPPSLAVASLFDGRQLVLGRELRRLTQSALASAIGVSAPAISQFENGKYRPAGSTLEMIADALDLPVAFLLADERFAPDRPAPFFRRLRGTRRASLHEAAARADLVRRLIVALEDLVVFERIELPYCEAQPETSVDAIEETAGDVRRSMSLAPGPIRRLIRNVEGCGVVVAHASLGDTAIDAFSVPYSDWPVIVLSTDKSDAARKRFDVAHEVGHLVMHVPPQKGYDSTLEAQAHCFAAAFLMPRDDILQELPARADWSALLRLKQRWGVSMSALVRRAYSLDVFDKPTYTNAMKDLSRKGWRHVEPGSIGEVEPPRLLTAGIAAATEGGTSLLDIAASAGVSLRDVQQLVDAVADERPQVHA